MNNIHCTSRYAAPHGAVIRCYAKMPHTTHSNCASGPDLLVWQDDDDLAFDASRNAISEVSTVIDLIREIESLLQDKNLRYATRRRTISAQIVSKVLKHYRKSNSKANNKTDNKTDDKADATVNNDQHVCCSHIEELRDTLKERTQLLIRLKGPCAVSGCTLYYDHFGSCDFKNVLLTEPTFARLDRHGNIWHENVDGTWSLLHDQNTLLSEHKLEDSYGPTQQIWVTPIIS